MSVGESSQLDRKLNVSDFLAVRKIPLTQYPLLDADLEEVESTRVPDVAASELLSDIRKNVLSDRQLADKVNRQSPYAVYSR